MADDNTNTLWAAVTHPLAAVSGLFVALLNFQAPLFDALLQTVWSHAGMLFAGVSLGGGRFGELLGVSQTAVNAALLVAGAIWLAKILDTLWDAFKRRLDSEMEDNSQ